MSLTHLIFSPLVEHLLSTRDLKSSELIRSGVLLNRGGATFVCFSLESNYRVARTTEDLDWYYHARSDELRLYLLNGGDLPQLSPAILNEIGEKFTIETAQLNSVERPTLPKLEIPDIEELRPGRDVNLAYFSMNLNCFETIYWLESSHKNYREIEDFTRSVQLLIDKRLQ